MKLPNCEMRILVKNNTANYPFNCMHTVGVKIKRDGMPDWGGWREFAEDDFALVPAIITEILQDYMEELK